MAIQPDQNAIKETKNMIRIFLNEWVHTCDFSFHCADNWDKSAITLDTEVYFCLLLCLPSQPQWWMTYVHHYDLNSKGSELNVVSGVSFIHFPYLFIFISQDQCILSTEYTQKTTLEHKTMNDVEYLGFLLRTIHVMLHLTQGERNHLP